MGIGVQTFLAAGLLFCCACTPAHRAAAPKKHEARLSPEQAKTVDQLYYKAVGAFSRNDMSDAKALLRSILRIAPSHKPALELQKKIRLASEQ